MYILQDFRCEDCSKVTEELVNPGDMQIACGCGGKAYQAITKIAVVGADSFNPHHDLQLGQWFESADHKKKFLRETGREQVSGPMSPRKSNKSNVISTRKQAKKEHGEKPWQKREY
jgi:hypothetical protein